MLLRMSARVRYPYALMSAEEMTVTADGASLCVARDASPGRKGATSNRGVASSYWRNAPEGGSRKSRCFQCSKEVTVRPGAAEEPAATHCRRKSTGVLIKVRRPDAAGGAPSAA